MSPGWWRRNALALAALVVLAPATAAVIGGNEWWGYSATDDIFPVTVPLAERGSFGGATWGPAEARFVTDHADADLPAGARVVEVSVPVSPGDQPLLCASPELREADGAGRQWDEDSSALGAEYDPDAPDSCASDRTDPYSVVARFPVPADAVGPFLVEFSLFDQVPSYLRLVVAP